MLMIFRILRQYLPGESSRLTQDHYSLSLSSIKKDSYSRRNEHFSYLHERSVAPLTPLSAIDVWYSKLPEWR